jgi:formylglycine-generating enzyme required for sulfatase activity
LRKQSKVFGVRCSGFGVPNLESGIRNLGWLLPLLLAGCGTKDTPPQASTPSIKSITTKTGIEMVLIPAGELTMGDESGEEDEKPAHKVQISAFYMDKFEVTQKAYKALMGKSPAKFEGDDRPVERASWTFAAKYCNMRSLKEGVKPCYNPETFECDFSADGYRLPTEAEWEYACRAGTATRFSFGGDSSKLAEFAWFKANAANATHPVGQKPPNPWGLCDMHGNVAEWCHDHYGESHYAKAEGKDPKGPPSGEDRVLRGGSWRDSAGSCRSSARRGEAPGLADVCFGYEAYGFRCVRKAPVQPAR